jgi:hypothetical protein
MTQIDTNFNFVHKYTYIYLKIKILDFIEKFRYFYNINNELLL